MNEFIFYGHCIIDHIFFLCFIGMAAYKVKALLLKCNEIYFISLKNVDTILSMLRVVLIVNLSLRQVEAVLRLCLKAPSTYFLVVIQSIFFGK